MSSICMTPTTTTTTNIIENRRLSFRTAQTVKTVTTYKPLCYDVRVWVVQFVEHKKCMRYTEGLPQKKKKVVSS